jgi:hypothetical protein
MEEALHLLRSLLAVSIGMMQDWRMLRRTTIGLGPHLPSGPSQALTCRLLLAGSYLQALTCRLLLAGSYLQALCYRLFSFAGSPQLNISSYLITDSQ